MSDFVNSEEEEEYDDLVSCGNDLTNPSNNILQN